MSNSVRVSTRSTPKIVSTLPLAALLCMSVSHHAVAACTEAAGILTCSGGGTMPGAQGSSALTAATINLGSTVQMFQFTEVPGNARYGGIVGQQLNTLGEYFGATTNTVAGEDAHGEDVDIAVGPGITITNNGTINNANAGVAPLATSRTSYGIHFDGSDNTIFNNGTISMSTGTTAGNNSGTMYGIYTSVADGENYYDNNHIINNGLIEVTRTANNSTGTARAIYFGEQQLGMIVDNNAGATIRATRLGTPTSTSTNIVAGIDTDDTPGTLTVNNMSPASTIEVTGDKTAAIYGRSTQTVINNSGTIRNNSWTAADTKNSQHYAIGSYAGSSLVPDPASLDPENPQPLLTAGRATIEDAAQLTLTNAATGMIIGDVLAVDANPLTVAVGGSLSATNLNTRNSVIDNQGTINGNIYLGSGNHTLTNGNSITQNIVVDQSDGNGAFAQPPGSPGCPAAPAACTLPALVHGDRAFTLDNTGTIGSGVTGGAANAKIQITDFADSVNTVTLHGTGFVGSVIATNGTGDNSLTLDGVTNLKSVQKFRSLDLMDSRVAVTNGVSLVDGASIHTNINGPGGTTAAPSTDLGSIDGTLTLLGDAAVTTTLNTTVHNGDVYQLATAASAAGDIDVDSGSAMVSFTADTAAGDLRLEATVKDASEIAGISSPGATTVNALIGTSGSSPALDGLAAAVESLPDDASVANAGAQLAPETNFATQQVAITLNNSVGQHIDTRLASSGATGGGFAPVTPAPSGLGMRPSDSNRDPGRSNLGATSENDPYFVPRSAAVWAKGFGAGLDQDRNNFVDGYKARLYGFLAGYDNYASPGFRLGVAGGYANTSIEGQGDTRQNQTGIDSYLVEAYASIKGAGWYATGRTGFTWHNYDTTRVLTVPFTDRATASHNGRQYNAEIEVGAPIRTMGAILTPVASLTYSHLDQDAYTENSGVGMALSVGSQSNDSAVSGLGLKALVPIAADTVIEGRAKWLHEFADTAQTVTAGFAAGGGSFTAAGPNVGRNSASLGAGILAQVDTNMTFELNYDANIRQDFQAHIGSAQLNINY